jgi:hypothetical protein
MFVIPIDNFGAIIINSLVSAFLNVLFLLIIGVLLYLYPRTRKYVYLITGMSITGFIFTFALFFILILIGAITVSPGL